MATSHRTALGDLRRLRTRRRLGDTEWFDVAYRVYLFGLAGLTGVVLASDAIGGLIGEDVTTSDVLDRWPPVLGLVAVMACATGLRSGADGGPVSIEVADIRHVLLAPIERWRVLLRPITQRLRAVAFGLALVGAVLGQLVARELDGSRAAWAGAGALYGALVGALFVSSAVIGHALRLPRWAATALGAGGLAAQGWAAWSNWSGDGVPGPANLVGSIGLWGIRQRAVDVAAVAAVVALVVLALLLGGRLRLEPLSRRGELVSQLLFAATMQDLRTVVALRRQLRAEMPRQRPWFSRDAPVRHASTRRPAGRAAVVWRRGIRSLRRLPGARVGRLVLLAALGGVCASLTITSSALFAAGLLACGFLAGMEALEPLSQEVDRPDRTDALPIDRGWLLAQHLVAPALLLVPVALIGAAAATLAEPAHAAAGFALAVPLALAAASGPVVATVLDAPSSLAASETTLTGRPRQAESPFALPEFAGFTNAFSTFMPVVLSGVAVLPVVALRVAPGAATVVRSIVGIVLFLTAVAWWVHRRDRWAARIRTFFAQGRAAA